MVLFSFIRRVFGPTAWNFLFFSSWDFHRFLKIFILGISKILKKFIIVKFLRNMCLRTFCGFLKIAAFADFLKNIFSRTNDLKPEFFSRDIIWPFFFKNKKRSGPYIIGLYWTNYCSLKLKRRICPTFGFNRKALRATHKPF